MARFQSSLNLVIWDKVELLPYNDLNDLLLLCVRVEQQILRRLTFRRVNPIHLILEENSRGRVTPPNLNMRSHEKKRRKKKRGIEKDKNKNKESSSKETRTRDIQFFRCLERGHYASDCSNKIIMVSKDQDIEGQDELISSLSEDEVLVTKEETPPYEG